MLRDADGGNPALQINFQNCVHCKTCDIKDPPQNITWTTPGRRRAELPNVIAPAREPTRFAQLGPPCRSMGSRAKSPGRACIADLHCTTGHPAGPALARLAAPLMGGLLLGQAGPGAQLRPSRAPISRRVQADHRSDMPRRPDYFARALQASPDNLALVQNLLVARIALGDMDEVLRSPTAFAAASRPTSSPLWCG